MDLDRIDYKIMEALQNNARLSNKELAAIVKLAPSTCLERVKRLKAAGILQGYHAKVAPAALKINLQALIAIKLHRHSREVVENFQKYATSLSEVIGVYHLTGANDFLLHVAVRDDQHLRNLLLDSFTTREEIFHIETSLIFEHQWKAVLPNYTKP